MLILFLTLAWAASQPYCQALYFHYITVNSHSILQNRALCLRGVVSHMMKAENENYPSSWTLNASLTPKATAWKSETLDVLRTFAEMLTFPQPLQPLPLVYHLRVCLTFSGTAGGRASLRAHLRLTVTTLSSKVSPPQDNIMHCFPRT